MLSDAPDDRAAPDPGWPMPSVEVQRQLAPVPRWAPAPTDDAEPDTD